MCLADRMHAQCGQRFDRHLCAVGYVRLNQRREDGRREQANMLGKLSVHGLVYLRRVAERDKPHYRA